MDYFCGAGRLRKVGKVERFSRRLSRRGDCRQQPERIAPLDVAKHPLSVLLRCLVHGFAPLTEAVRGS
jgi:hypothetical protein